MQGLAKSIAWDGEGATCLIEVYILIKPFITCLDIDTNIFLHFKWLFEKNKTAMIMKKVPYLLTTLKVSANGYMDIQVTVSGAENESKAAKIARSVASSSLVKACNLNSTFA